MAEGRRAEGGIRASVAKKDNIGTEKFPKEKNTVTNDQIRLTPQDIEKVTKGAN